MKIRPIRKADAPRFHEMLDAVCKERKYLAAFEAPSPEEVRKFIDLNVREKIPRFFEEVDGRLVGWCDVIPGPVSRSHVGTLGMGVLRDYLGRRIGVGLWGGDEAVGAHG